ncbi:MAG: hypothetical protein ACLPVW_03850 [Terriglobales bacterium]
MAAQTVGFFEWDQFAFPSGATLHPYSRDPRSFDVYLYQAISGLAAYRRYRSSLYGTFVRLNYGEWTYGSEDYWSYEFETLLWQASKLGIADCRLREAQDLAASDVFGACRLLVRELHRRVIERVALLQAGLLSAKILAAILLIRFVAGIYRFHNAITLQRRFFLAHGSHPIDRLLVLIGRFGSSVRGRAPVFAL